MWPPFCIPLPLFELVDEITNICNSEVDELLDYFQNNV